MWDWIFSFQSLTPSVRDPCGTQLISTMTTVPLKFRPPIFAIIKKSMFATAEADSRVPCP